MQHHMDRPGKKLDTIVLVLAIMTVTLIATAFHAWRLGNERRDVALLAVFGGLFATGTAVAASL